jgi:hypothetical protein
MYSSFLLAFMIYLPREVEQVYPRPGLGFQEFKGCTEVLRDQRLRIEQNRHLA